MSSKQGQLARWARVKCPFFHGDNSVSIICEGCEEKSSIRQTFANGEMRRDWEKVYCDEHDKYPLCPIYQLAMRKYEE